MKSTKMATIRDSAHKSTLQRWISDEKKIFFLLVSYGFIMGIINYVDSFTSDSVTSYLFNLPAYLIITIIEFNIFNPMGLAPFYEEPIAIIPGSTFAWAVIGFIIFAVIRFRKGINVTN
jgi:hypothetical protein